MDDQARYGLEMLKAAVFWVLHQARGERMPFLDPTQIGERLGILPTRWETEGENALILSVLNRLEAEERVEKLWIGTYKWQVSKAEIKVIEG